MDWFSLSAVSESLGVGTGKLAIMTLLLQYLNSVLLGLTFTLLCYTCYYLLRRFKSSEAKSAPEAGGAWPIIGHLPLLGGRELPHITLAAVADKYGPIFTIRIGMYTALVINNSELAKEIFTSNDVAVLSRPKLAAAKLLGYNYLSFAFTPFGDYWNKMRKITALELLSSRRLELLKHIRASEVEDSIRDLYKLWTKNKDEARRVLVNMNRVFNDVNGNVIMRMVAGKRYFGTEGSEARRFQMALREFFQLAGLFVLRDAFPFLGWLDFGGYEKAMKRNAKELDSIVAEWLEEHRKKRETKEVANKEQDFMDVLLSVLNGPDVFGYDSDTVWKSTAMALISGGSDTTTVSVTWALALLLNHPNSLKKVQEELDNKVGKERPVKESDIEKLVYLQAVLKESMRLYPAGPLSAAREFDRDCIIGGYHIPAGTWLLVNLHKLHRDPRVWANPEEFEPERFLNTHKEIDVKSPNFELIPFGGGRRACPGLHFAILMNQFLLASFLQVFEMSAPSNAPIDMSGTAGLTNGKATPLEVLLKPRLPLNLYE